MRLGKLQSASSWLSFRVKEKKKLIRVSIFYRNQLIARCFNFDKKLMVMKPT